MMISVKKYFTFVLMFLLLLFSVFSAVAANESDSDSPATGQATYITDVKDEPIQYDAEGNIISKTTIKGITIRETGSGYDPNFDKSKGYTTPIRKTPGPSPRGPESETGVGKVIQGIIGVGSLTFLFGGNADSQLCGFLRILLAILVFTLLYLLLSMIPGLTRGIAITIGIILAIVVAVFTPCVVLLAWGTSYATLFAFVVVFGPVLAGLMLLLFTPTPNRRVALLKLMIVVILMWLVREISYWAMQIGGK
ncbi:hypothetical protein HYT55_04430 [Candidatus Woesearchaeota archaeon]|nr:hypothetical protein [Candidatus Woesearchaeota archaeon]